MILPLEIRKRIADRVIRVVCPVSFIAAIPGAVALLVLLPEEHVRLFSTCSAFVLAPLIWWVNAKGHSLAAAAVLVAAGAAIILSMLIAGGPAVPIFAGNLTIIIIITSLYGTRTAVVFAAGMLGIGGLCLWAEHAQLLQFSAPPSPEYMLFDYGIWMALTIIFISVPISLMHDALSAAEERRGEVEFAQLAERQSSMAFHAVFDQAFQIMGLLDSNGRFLAVNSAAEAWLGVPSMELDGKPLVELSWWSNDEREQFREAIENAAQGEQVRFQILRDKGMGEKNRFDERAIDISISPFRDAEDSIVYLIMEGHDVTELVRAQRRLTQVQKMDAIGQLAGGIAHDFNNMLGGILGAADVIVDESREQGPSDPSREHAEMIIKTVKRASNLTGKLLSLSRQGKMVSEPFDLDPEIEEVVSILERTLDRNIRIHRHLEAVAPRILGDSSEVSSAILNLCINARDAMPNGGKITIRTAARMMDADACGDSPFELHPGEYVDLSVTDTGAGIPPEIRDRIFDPFFTTKARRQGTGLGLAAVYGTVKDHHGAISVFSEAGSGAEFHILLPVTGAKNALSPETGEGAAPVVSLSGCVLVVEDELPIRIAVERALAGKGCEVLMAEDGEEGLEIYRANASRIDAVLLDLVMPKMDGRELFWEIREINPDAKVLLSSGFVSDESIADLFAEGLVGFIRKPYRGQELLEQMSRILPHRSQ